MKSLPKKKQNNPAEKAVTMPLGAINYLMIAFGVLVIAGSYWGMYLEKAADGFLALFVSPLTLIGAYLWIVFAVLYQPKAQKKQQG